MDPYVERNRQALKRVLLALVAMAGFGGNPATLPRHLHRAILRLLRPAEAAARRLAIVLARGLVVAPAKPRPAKPKPASLILRSGIGTGLVLPRGVAAPGAPAAAARPPPRTFCLPLLDPLRPWGRRRRPVAGAVPRICVPGFTALLAVPVRRPRAPDDPIAAVRLALRLAALARALDDLPRQALRFARWRARQRVSHAGGKICRIWPLRMGRPPGAGRGPAHAVHDVLTNADALALEALEAFDTS